MTDTPPSGSAPALWDRAGLPSSTAIGRATLAAAVAVVLATLVGFVGGPEWAFSVAVGGVVVLFVLWGSARLLTAGVRRSSPVVALGLAVTLYLVVVVGLFVLAVQARPGPGADGLVRAAGVAGGALGVVLVWSVALVAVHIRHDREPRLGGRRGG